ncbi:Methyl esterase 13, putative isoform 3 [Theobroma cacao]|uniref:Methyl esterase 13, putative isoform 3 n=1 Tax=Theobroma cacao TaxID=3641 RepID=A0A061EAR4_THECC|nr:Methyl esterase 13, putative isoform 3 [Theobroma cacao]
MGNTFGCIYPDDRKASPRRASRYPPPRPLPSRPATSSSAAFTPSFNARPSFLSSFTSSSSRKERDKRRASSAGSLDLDQHESAVIQEQAIAAALLFRHHQSNNSLPFIRSTSVVHPSPGSKKHRFPRSSSTRQPSPSDPTLRPQQLVNSQQTGSNDLMRQAQIFLYANGNNNPPTAVDLNKTSLRDLFFNQSSAKDVALASVSMRPIPFAPVLEKLSLSDMNYGSIRRFYVKTQEDRAIAIPLQEAMIKSNPPEQVFQLKGSDHAPFFSRPQGLHKILIEIAQLPAKQACSSAPELRHLLEYGTF